MQLKANRYRRTYVGRTNVLTKVFTTSRGGATNIANYSQRLRSMTWSRSCRGRASSHREDGFERSAAACPSRFIARILSAAGNGSDDDRLCSFAASTQLFATNARPTLKGSATTAYRSAPVMAKARKTTLMTRTILCRLAWCCLVCIGMLTKTVLKTWVFCTFGMVL